TNLDEVIANYVAPQAGTYYARLTRHSAAQDRDYDLVVTRSAAFDTENNDDAAHAQTLLTGRVGGAPGDLVRPDRTALGMTLDGLSSGDNSEGVSPPDTTLAVGPEHVVEATNLALRIYDKAGNVLRTQQFAVFFAPPSMHELSDPQVVFD